MKIDWDSLFFFTLIILLAFLAGCMAYWEHVETMAKLTNPHVEQSK